ncbi:NAD-dependent epimerase/dehydratase family protein [Angustibacter sp. McL0619]|uniref:NAD-dependent epimerase/dehydratase family protein n=1 Tax=Angustibacter sp. McL0619 TaxID=3415676 RepID=UPI003CECD04A
MTTLLVLGGTAWLGREVAKAGLARGQDVTCLARGESGRAADGVRWVAADRTESDAYDEVNGQDWDAVVDVSWQPGMVRSALVALSDRAGHWGYVSSCSVYARHDVVDADESADLLPALDADEASREQYGEAKVACERLCQDALGDRLLVARSGLIGGYGDPSDRFGYWPGRFARAVDGAVPVLVPDIGAGPTQTCDVRDLAQWLVRCGEQRTVGVFNALGARHSFGEVLAECRAVTGYDGAQQLVSPGWLTEHEVEEYMGPRSIPLWIGDPEWQGFSARAGSAAVAAGLSHRPLTDLVEQSLRWERELGLDRDRRAGLTPDEERELLAVLG